MKWRKIEVSRSYRNDCVICGYLLQPQRGDIFVEQQFPLVSEPQRGDIKREGSRGRGWSEMK